MRRCPVSASVRHNNFADLLEASLAAAVPAAEHARSRREKPAVQVVAISRNTKTSTSSTTTPRQEPTPTRVHTSAEFGCRHPYARILPKDRLAHRAEFGPAA